MTIADYQRQIVSGANYLEAKMARPQLVPMMRRHSNDPRYMLVEDYFFVLPNGAQMKIDSGYTYDGASIWSRIGLTWALSVPPYHPWVMRGAMVHDVLCDIEPDYCPSSKAADMFERDIKIDGISESTASRMVRFVKWFGPSWGDDDA